jgi:hypothetical protein
MVVQHGTLFLLSYELADLPVDPLVCIKLVFFVFSTGVISHALSTQCLTISRAVLQKKEKSLSQVIEHD